MKVITDYFTSPLPKKNCHISEDAKSDDEDYLPLRKIKIRLADPSVPDSYICEVYDTSLEESQDEDLPLNEIAEQMSRVNSLPKTKTINPEVSINEDAKKVLMERNDNQGESSTTNESGRRISSRVRRPVIPIEPEYSPEKKRKRSKLNKNELSKNSIAGYLKRSVTESPMHSNIDTQKENSGTCPAKTVLAPIFLPPNKKPKIDPEKEKSRKAFLLSGIPITSKKTNVADQKYPDEYFSPVQHVQQRNGESAWRKRSVTLQLKNVSLETEVKCGAFQWPCLPEPKANMSLTKSIKLSKKAIERMKIAYKQIDVEGIYKNNKKLQSVFKKEGGSNDIVWSEKYRPASEGILDNQSIVQNIKIWLSEWKSNGRTLCRQDEEQDSSDEECNGSQNACLLQGPIGCGKTALVYALAKELDLNVIEINASTKRAGKKLLSELQEATRSREVREEKGSAVILVEDADIVFDEDEGFVAALQSLINSSKRPVILLTSDPSAEAIEKFRGSHILQLQMKRPSASAACAMLEIMCCLEGVCPPRSSLLNLLLSNNLDLRRCILNLQFWSGKAGWELPRNQQLMLSSVWWRSNEILFHEPLWHQNKTWSEEQSETLKTDNIPVQNETLRFLENMSLCDVISQTNDISNGLPHAKVVEKDGLCLLEDFRVSTFVKDKLNSDIATTILGLSGLLNYIHTDTPPTENRWLESRNEVNEELRKIIPRGVGRPVSVDYFPSLRAMVRTESEGAAGNSRRSRGFPNLKTLGISPSSRQVQIILSTFNEARVQNN